ncbi:hypothetical protein NEOC65_000979 [Neochlamydia sp. AcF65]|nr:hypothetical protein [Neochlamydia sp. AcF65]
MDLRAYHLISNLNLMMASTGSKYIEIPSILLFLVYLCI